MTVFALAEVSARGVNALFSVVFRRKRRVIEFDDLLLARKPRVVPGAAAGQGVLGHFVHHGIELFPVDPKPHEAWHLKVGDQALTASAPAWATARASASGGQSTPMARAISA